MHRSLNVGRWVSDYDAFQRRNAYIRHAERFHVETLIEEIIFTECGWWLVLMYNPEYGFALCMWDGFPHVRVPMSQWEQRTFPTANWDSYIPF